MRLPIYLDDLRGNGRTVAIVFNGHAVRLVTIDRDGFNERDDVEVVVADVSIALLRNALEDLPAPLVTQAVPVARRPGRRKPRWWGRKGGIR